MNTAFSVHFSCQSRKKNIFILSGLYVVSIVFGLLLAFYSDPIIVSLMGAAPGSCASIVDLLAVAVYPFLLAAVFVMMFQSYGLLLLCFLKLSCFMFLLTGTVLYWGSSAWLVSVLLLFSCGISCTCLLLFTMRCFVHENTEVHYDLFVCFLLSIAAAVIEHTVFAPLLAKIII